MGLTNGWVSGLSRRLVWECQDRRSATLRWVSSGDIVEAAAWGLLGTLVGALTSVGTTWLSNQTSHKIQSSKQADERAERAKEFQRETLLTLQEAIHDALRLSARAHMEDFEQFKKTGDWNRGLLSDEVSEGLRLARRRVAILIERVADESLRSDVKSLMRVSAEGVLARSKQDAEMNQQAVSVLMTPLLEKIGSVLRSHY